VPGLEASVERALRDWNVPGAAIAIIKEDAVVYERGFGVRTLGTNDKIDQNTIFSIASTTKAMTAACLGMLADEGKLSWDDPVTKWLPEFALSDPYASRQLTVRDLLTHRSGLPRGDMLWYGSGYDRSEILKRVRLLQPAWGFRARYGYQNIMYMAAGEVVRSASGMSWDAFMKERLFGPLGMGRSSTSVRDLQGAANVATPHEEVDDTVRAVRWPNYDNIGGAGSGNSTAHDMAQWARLMLNNGVYEGKRLLQARTVEEITSPQMINRLDSVARALRPSSHFLTYGLGWGLVDYLGRKVVTHDGWLDGMRSRIMLIPEERLGVVILLNGPRASLHTALAYQIVDHYLGAPKKDWSAEYLRMSREDEKKAAENRSKREEKRVKDTSPAMPLGSYVGTYRNEIYGDLVVQLERGVFVMKFGEMYVGDLAHRHFETFQVNWHDRVLGWDEVMFTHSFDGTVAGCEWSGVGTFLKRDSQ
jgi:CubicO group peptidase (beta-lactamase class C family)